MFRPKDPSDGRFQQASPHYYRKARPGESCLIGGEHCSLDYKHTEHYAAVAMEPVANEDPKDGGR